MREIDRLAKDAAWSTTELARRLGVDPTMLMHIRAGRNQFSASLLGKIAQVFPTPAMDALIVHHLRVERAARSAMTLAVPDDAALDAFDAETRRALRAFVLHFARASVETAACTCAMPTPHASRAQHSSSRRRFTSRGSSSSDS